MGIRKDQCNKVCRIIDDYLANRPRERDELITAVRTVFAEADRKNENSSENPNNCDTCKHWEADTAFCYSKADSDDHACHYEPKDEPQTCSFSDCDNFKNPNYERCIECKRKQIKLKTEQTERSE